MQWPHIIAVNSWRFSLVTVHKHIWRFCGKDKLDGADKFTDWHDVVVHAGGLSCCILLLGPGGIQRYMEAFPGHDSLFRGSLFVFDERISVPSTAGGALSYTMATSSCAASTA